MNVNPTASASLSHQQARAVIGQPVVQARSVSPAQSAHAQRVLGAPVVPGLQRAQPGTMSPVAGQPLLQHTLLANSAASRRHTAGLMSPPGGVLVPGSATRGAPVVIPRPATVTAPHMFGGLPQGPSTLTLLRHVKRPNYDACYQHSYKLRAYSPI